MPHTEPIDEETQKVINLLHALGLEHGITNKRRKLDDFYYVRGYARGQLAFEEAKQAHPNEQNTFKVVEYAREIQNKKAASKAAQPSGGT